MIQNINPVDFNPFGTILTDASGRFSNGRPLDVKEGDAPLFHASEPVGIGSLQGLCILSVSPDGSTFQSFCLDKPVMLKEGIFFAVSTVNGSASVTLSGKFTDAGIYSGADGALLRPRFRIQSIYTFFYQEKETGFVFPGEAHPMLELTYLDRGKLHSVADGRHIELSQGDILLYGPGQWHMQYADVGVAPMFVTVTFECEGADFSALYNRILRLPEAKELLRQALAEQSRESPLGKELIFSLLSLLLLRLLCAEDGRKEESLPSTNENRIVGASQQYIADHIREKLSVPLVARQVQVSPGYLSSLYQKHLHISPGEYIRRVKLQECKQLIREEKMNFTQIATMMEYSTVHHFSRQFKEKFGITPTEYARSIK